METIIKSKARVYGECINSHELLEALKNDVFIDLENPVQVHTLFNLGFLKLAYLCPDCHAIHLCAGEIEQNLHKTRTGAIQILFDKSGAGEMMTHGELIAVLESIPEAKKVTIEYSGESSMYSLVTVFKCSHCNGVHLDSAYDHDCMGLN